MLFFLGCTLSTLTSCGTAEKIKWSTEHLTLKSAYTQRYVPGLPDERVVSYLILDLEMSDPHIVLERVLFRGHSSPVSAVKWPLKVDWEQGASDPANPELPDNEAILFYAQGEKHYKLRITDIQTKEDLYLP